MQRLCKGFIFLNKANTQSFIFHFYFRFEEGYVLRLNLTKQHVVYQSLKHAEEEYSSHLHSLVGLKYYIMLAGNVPSYSTKLYKIMLKAETRNKTFRRQGTLIYLMEISADYHLFLDKDNHVIAFPKQKDARRPLAQRLI